MNTGHQPSRNRVTLLLGPACFLAVWFGADLDPEHPEMTRMAAVAVWMAAWWLTEAIPLSITALIPIVLYPFLGIMNGKEVSTLYINHIVFLFIGGFMVALALQRWDLHKRIALIILRFLGTKPSRVLLGFMIATAFLSMWISNTATTMMMVPIALSVTMRLHESSEPGKATAYAKAIFLGIAFSASIGGMATLVGTPPNMVFVRIFEQSFPDAEPISFARWMIFALPISLFFLVICWNVLYHAFRLPSVQVDMDRDVFDEEYAKLGPFATPERRICMAAVALGLLWIFRADIDLGFAKVPGWSRILDVLLDGSYAAYVTDGTVAILVALLLFIIPAGDGRGSALLDWPTAVKLPWDIVLLFGGGFALAAGFSSTGLTHWLGEQLHVLSGYSPILIIACVCLLATFLTELTSNTGTTQIFLPVMVAVAAAIGVDALMLMIPATLSCSCAFMLPVATPPNAIIFGTGSVTVRDMARVGVILNFTGAVLITLGVYTMGRWSFGF